MIEVLVIDLAGVAARFFPERRLELLSTLTGLEAARLQDRLFNSGLDGLAEQGVFTHDETVSKVLDALDHSVSQRALIEAWSTAFEPNIVVLEHLETLRVRRVLFTNNGPLMDACLEGPLKHLAAGFSEVVCSWHLKVRKPDPAAFAGVVRRLCLAPEQLYLLDDSLENVEAARRCGWNAACVSDAESVIAATKHL